MDQSSEADERAKMAAELGVRPDQLTKTGDLLWTFRGTPEEEAALRDRLHAAGEAAPTVRSATLDTLAVLAGVHAGYDMKAAVAGLEREKDRSAAARAVARARQAGRRNVGVYHPGPAPRRAEIRLGRNAKCPCGSGKKYKACHKQYREPRA